MRGDDQIQEDGMGGECGTDGRIEKCTHTVGGKRERKQPLGIMRRG